MFWCSVFINLKKLTFSYLHTYLPKPYYGMFQISPKLHFKTYVGILKVSFNKVSIILKS